MNSHDSEILAYLDTFIVEPSQFTQIEAAFKHNFIDFLYKNNIVPLTKDYLRRSGHSSPWTLTGTFMDKVGIKFNTDNLTLLEFVFMATDGFAFASYQRTSGYSGEPHQYLRKLLNGKFYNGSDNMPTEEAQNEIVDILINSVLDVIYK